MDEDDALRAEDDEDEVTVILLPEVTEVSMPRIIAAPFSAMAYVGLVKCAARPMGMIEESITRRLLMP